MFLRIVKTAQGVERPVNTHRCGGLGQLQSHTEKRRFLHVANGVEQTCAGGEGAVMTWGVSLSGMGGGMCSALM